MKQTQVGILASAVLVIAMMSLSFDALSKALPLSFSDLHQITQQIESPRELARFMRKNFKFKDDHKLFGVMDHWQSPEEFWTLKKGDCEDYALFTKYVLDSIGIESYVVSFYGDNGYAHTVTVYKEDGKYNVINEDRHYKYREPTIEEALSRIYPQWRWGGIAQKRGTRGWMAKRLTNNKYKANSDYRSNFSEFPF